MPHALSYLYLFKLKSGMHGEGGPSGFTTIIPYPILPCSITSYRVFPQCSKSGRYDDASIFDVSFSPGELDIFVRWATKAGRMTC